MGGPRGGEGADGAGGPAAQTPRGLAAPAPPAAQAPPGLAAPAPPAAQAPPGLTAPGVGVRAKLTLRLAADEGGRGLELRAELDVAIARGGPGGEIVWASAVDLGPASVSGAGVTLRARLEFTLAPRAEVRAGELAGPGPAPARLGEGRTELDWRTEGERAEADAPFALVALVVEPF